MRPFYLKTPEERREAAAKQRTEQIARASVALVEHLLPRSRAEVRLEAFSALTQAMLGMVEALKP